MDRDISLRYLGVVIVRYKFGPMMSFSSEMLALRLRIYLLVS